MHEIVEDKFKWFHEKRRNESFPNKCELKKKGKRQRLWNECGYIFSQKYSSEIHTNDKWVSMTPGQAVVPSLII